MKATGTIPADVIIPVYNGEKYIAAALDSVDAQTRPPARIIVVDDGSTDGTAEMVRAHVGRVPVELVSKPNGGLSSARNAGILASSSEYLAFLDADDLWCPEKLEKQYAIFTGQDDANLGLVYCAYLAVDESGAQIESVPIIEIDPSIKGAVFEKLLYRNLITGSASGALMRRRCFESVGLFDESLKACEDWDMWLRVSERFFFDYVAEKLVRIRVHGGNMQGDNTHMFRNTLAFYDKWTKRLPAKSACFREWRKFVFYKSVNGKNIDYLKIASKSLSSEALRKLFPLSGGSIVFGFLLFLPLAVVRFVSKRLTAISAFSCAT